MPRVKTGFTRRRRHKKILDKNKGYWGSRSKLYRIAHEAYVRAGEHAFKGRKERKRDFKRLWIQRINAGLSEVGIKYNIFMAKMKKSKIELNRKMLSELAVNDFETFKKVVEKVNKD